MTLATPKIVVLDSATLGKVSHDYWSPEKTPRDKARSFLARLQDTGVFVTLTVTHVIELLRHENEQIVRDRLRFLRSIPFIAWLRPYDCSWFPGGPTDLLCRELHVVVHGSARNWREIVDEVRPELWKTGMGCEIFVENDELWSTMRKESNLNLENEKHVASVDRVDPCGIMDAKLCDVSRMSVRPKEDRETYLREFEQTMQKQLERHGDKRLGSSRQAALDFANVVRQDLNAIDEMGGDPKQRLLESSGVPMEFVFPEMTIREHGELSIYAKRLKRLAKRLRPPIELTMKDVPAETLPSHVLERRLASLQRKAERVSGSDLGDGHIAPLVFYTDGVEVDKRTCEFLNQVRRKEPRLASLMGLYFRSSDYAGIPSLFNQ